MAQAGMEVADVESLRRHYARTCHERADRIDANRDQAIAAAGEKRLRIWQIYLAGCAYGFEHEWMNIYQVLACKGAHPCSTHCRSRANICTAADRLSLNETGSHVQ